MKTFAIDTLGCKVNQYESQQIRELLERLGLHQVKTADKPDLVVVNTCCVTQTAAAKSRQHSRKARNLSPDAVIVVSGCLAALQTGELNDMGDDIRLVKHQDDLAAILGHIISSAAGSESQGLQPYPDTSIRTETPHKIKCKNRLAPQPKLTQLTSFEGQTRAFLKVQDGCDGYCSYCIIPKTRPHVRSKPAEAALREARALVKAGHKEIVVTGIFLGAYGQASVRRKIRQTPHNDRLADLLEKMAQIPDLARLRLSSLEPTDVSERLLDTLCRYPNMMPHLHLSLQSGSNAVLKRMSRQYTADEFLKTVDSIKSRLDRPAITTDIIVGFPGETDADFQQTVDLAKQVGFAKMHVFSFSPHRGTAAARMQPVAASRVIKERSQILRDLDIELGGRFRQQFIGEQATVLVENGDGRPCGRSERYFVVHLEKTGPACRKNELVKVELTENGENGAIGRPVAREG